MRKYSHAGLNATAVRISRLPIDEARAHLSELLRLPTDVIGVEREVMLDYNARLVTELRERRVPIWADDLE